MEQRVVTVLLLSGFFTLSCGIYDKILHFIPKKMDWPSARTYCTENYVDMASFSDATTLAVLSGLVDTADQYAFVGLKREWQWYVPEEEDQRGAKVRFNKFENGDPEGPLRCGQMQPSGNWTSALCSREISFICYNESLPERFVWVNDTKTISEAHEYCRSTHTDLARVQNEAENVLLANLIYGEPAWIGLMRKWVWSDGTYPSFLPWASTTNPIHHCGALSVSADPGQITSWDCNSTLPFFCYSYARKKLTLKIAVSGAENSVPLTPDSLTKLLQNKLKEQGYSKDVHMTWIKSPQKTQYFKGEEPHCFDIAEP